MKVRIDPLDKLFSHYLRLKAKGICQKCLGDVGYNRLQVSHFIGRRYKSLRWDEENCAVLCFACHQHFHEQPLEHVDWFRARLGDKFDLLRARARMPARYLDKEAIRLYLEIKIKELEE